MRLDPTFQRLPWEPEPETLPRPLSGELYREAYGGCPSGFRKWGGAGQGRRKQMAKAKMHREEENDRCEQA